MFGRRIKAGDRLRREFDPNGLFDQPGNLVVSLSLSAELFDFVAHHADEGGNGKLLGIKAESFTKCGLCGAAC